MGDDTEWIKLPTLEKIAHKNWKARQSGYQEAKKEFLVSTGGCNQYLGEIKRFVNDANLVALESGLEAVVAFIEYVPSAKKCAEDICSSVTTKCLSSTRAKTKEYSNQILMMYIEVEKQDIVIDNVVKGLSNKVPKVVVSCLDFLTQALHAFGNKVISIKAFIKDVLGVLEHRDKNVREYAKGLIVEIYRWIGKAITAQISSVKPTVQSELNAEFEKIEPSTIKPTRWLDSQKLSEAEIEKMNKTKEGSGDEESKEVDQYDIAPEVEILEKLPDNFYQLLESTNWKERKESLDALETASQNVIRCKPGDYNELLKAINKVIAKDSNIILVAQAAKLATFLFTSLRENVAFAAGSLFSTCLEKFKEKNAAVVTQLRALIDEVFKYLTYENTFEQIQEALANKNPAIKAETVLFLHRFLYSLPKGSLRYDKKTVKSLCTGLLKTCQDAAPEVRDASFEALGMMMHIASEKMITTFLGDLDSIKMDKIKESFEKASASKASLTPEKISKPSEDAKKEEGGAPKEKSWNAAKMAKIKAIMTLPSEPPMGDDTAEQKCKDFFSEATIGQLTAVEWKEKKKALESMAIKVEVYEAKDIPLQAIVKFLCKEPGLKEPNFYVLLPKIELLDTTLKNHGTCSALIAETLAPELVEKIGDVTAGKGCQKCLTTLSDCTKFELVGSIVMKAATTQKNPKNQLECINWLSENIKLFGQLLNVKELIETIQPLLSHKDAGIRSSTVALCGTLHLYIGDRIKALLASEKPTTIQLIESEIEKHVGEKAPAPTMGYASRLQLEEDEEASEENDGGAPKEKSLNAAKIANGNIGMPPIPLCKAVRIIELGGKVDAKGNLIKETAPPATKKTEKSKEVVAKPLIPPRVSKPPPETVAEEDTP